MENKFLNFFSFFVGNSFFFQMFLVLVIGLFVSVTNVSSFLKSFHTWNFNMRNVKESRFFLRSLRFFANGWWWWWFAVDPSYQLRILNIILITIFAFRIDILEFYKFLRSKLFKTSLVSVINSNFLSNISTF